MLDKFFHEHDQLLLLERVIVDVIRPNRLCVHLRLIHPLMRGLQVAELILAFFLVVVEETDLVEGFLRAEVLFYEVQL